MKNQTYYNGYHSTKEMQLKDFTRDQCCNSLGVHVLRFSNIEIEFEVI